MGDDIRIQTFRRLLASMQPGRLLDLATGHGVFAIVAAEMGWKVTAVDVRTKRMPMTPGIEWVESDVREYEIGDFDAISNLGLLYHMELKDQLDLLRRCSRAPTIIDTHFSIKPDHEEDGYEGHTFDELAGRTLDQHRSSGTASWRNLSSFWPTEPALARQFYDSGFATVLKVEPSYQEDRSFYLCLPPRPESESAIDLEARLGKRTQGPRGKARRGLTAAKRRLRKQ